MENQKQLESLTEHLRSHKIRTSTAEYRWDRSSGALVLRAAFDNGTSFNFYVMNPPNAGEIRDLYQENLKARFAEESEFKDLLKLDLRKRYTILLESEFGLGVNSLQFTLERIQVGRFAQHAHCIDLVVQIKRKRDLRILKFYGRMSFALFDGWIEINTDPFGPVDTSGVLPSRQSKYASFDDRYMTDAIGSAGSAPLFQRVESHRREKGSTL